MLTCWWRRWAGKGSVASRFWGSPRRRPSPVRLGVEVLEDRTVPATFNVAPGDVAGLYAALNIANANGEQDTVNLAPGATYTLTAPGSFPDGAPTGLTLVADGGNLLTINGQGATIARAADSPAFRIFEVNSGAFVMVSDLTLTNGNVPGDGGGGIMNFGTLTLTNSILAGNSASYGGGVYNIGTLTITNSTLSANSATDGGGIYIFAVLDGTVRLTNSTLFANTAQSDGGGIFNLKGTLTITNSTLSGNSAGTYGGGIDNDERGTLTITNSTLSGNSAVNSGGGIDNSGTATVNASTLSGNWASSNGGGISNYGTATVSGSTLSGNTAASFGGGAIFNNTDSRLTVSGSTLSGNSAGLYGGGIINYGTATVSGSTLSGNSASSGGGIYSPAPPTLRNTILAGNTAVASGPDVQNSVVSNGNNLVGNTADSSGWVGSDLLNVDPLLGPLANNGGPTLTHALMAGSPALDAGSNIGAPPLDQRGFNRIVDGPDADTTATTDIGAFEAQIWIADVADQATNEDSVLAFSFATSLGIANVTATSDNPALVRAANLRVTGAGALRTLTITPLANQSGTALITVTVSDGTASMTDTFVLTVNPVNDAPLLDASGVMRLQAINEDDVSSFGTRVSDVILSAAGDRITDVDGGAVEGIAVTGVNNTNGAWQFSTDSAATWTSFGAASATQARLLAAGAFVRFVPKADFNGAVDLAFRAWDQTSGVNGGTADTSVSGGSTAFSTASATTRITVIAVNDAPVNTVPPAQKTTVNTPLVFSSARRISIKDVDAGSSIMRVTLNVTNGTLLLGTTAGLTSVAGNGKAKITLTGTLASINAALNNLRYRPTTGFRGKAKLTIFTEDLGNSGLGGPKTVTDAVSISVV